MLDPLADIVGEFASVAEANASGIVADAVVLATAGSQGRGADISIAIEPLTAREEDVLALLAEGLPNKAIAERLGISDQTVKFHVASITAKLGASNRTEAVRLAFRRGLITL
ncbi:MAG: response regulator transcription factor [Vicinamibacterales bacterium]